MFSLKIIKCAFCTLGCLTLNVNNDVTMNIKFPFSFQVHEKENGPKIFASSWIG